MRNISSIIIFLNHSFLNSELTSFRLNCRVNDYLPLMKEYLQPNIIYRTDIMHISNNN